MIYAIEKSFVDRIGQAQNARPIVEGVDGGLKNTGLLIYNGVRFVFV